MTGGHISGVKLFRDTGLVFQRHSSLMIRVLVAA